MQKILPQSEIQNWDVFKTEQALFKLNTKNFMKLHKNHEKFDSLKDYNCSIICNSNMGQAGWLVCSSYNYYSSYSRWEKEEIEAT